MKTLLFIDDEVDIREGVADLLKFDGWRVVPANDGLDALEWLASNPPPTAVLLDLRMPRCDGYEFRRRQLQDAALAEIPTIVLTAEGRFEADCASALAGLPVLQKPFEWHELRAALGAIASETPGLAPDRI